MILSYLRTRSDRCEDKSGPPRFVLGREWSADDPNAALEAIDIELCAIGRKLED